MAERQYKPAVYDPPKRVQVLRGSGTGYWKAGQFGYVRVANTHGGFFCVDRDAADNPSKKGELVYLVSKSKDGRGGALWFSHDAVRFTGKGR